MSAQEVRDNVIKSEYMQTPPQGQQSYKAVLYGNVWKYSPCNSGVQMLGGNTDNSIKTKIQKCIMHLISKFLYTV